MCSEHLVTGADDDRIPGPAASKKARRDFVERVHSLVPTNDALMDQLASCDGATLEGWMQARELAYAGLGIEDTGSSSELPREAFAYYS